MTASTIQILVSPPGYDNVSLVLQSLGGLNASITQLDDDAAGWASLEDSSFLARFDHLFLNCHARLDRTPPQRLVTAIARFVTSGGSLYTSDFASGVLERMLPGRIGFQRDMPALGSVPVTGAGLWLAQQASRSLTVNFDMDSWHLVQRFPGAADVYLLDSDGNPLALGFRHGRGHIVFTSFHHSAQTGGMTPSVSPVGPSGPGGGGGAGTGPAGPGGGDATSPAGPTILESEKDLLGWLVLLTTQHRSLQGLNSALATLRRTTAQRTTVYQLDENPLRLPVEMPRPSATGIFALSWPPSEDLKLSMSYLRGQNRVAETSSDESPLLLIVSGPKPADHIEIRIVDGFELIQETKKLPVAFAAATSGGEVEKEDWLASEIVQNITAQMEDWDTSDDMWEKFSVDRIERTLERVLRGLGYETRSEECEQGNSARLILTANWCDHSEHHEDQILSTWDIRVVHRGESLRRASAPELSGDDFPKTGRFDRAEHYFLCIMFFTSAREQIGDDRETRSAFRETREFDNWSLLARETISASRSQGVITAEDYARDQRMSVSIFSSKIHDV